MARLAPFRQGQSENYRQPPRLAAETIRFTYELTVRFMNNIVYVQRYQQRSHGVQCV